MPDSSTETGGGEPRAERVRLMRSHPDSGWVEVSDLTPTAIVLKEGREYGEFVPASHLEQLAARFEEMAEEDFIAFARRRALLEAASLIREKGQQDGLSFAVTETADLPGDDDQLDRDGPVESDCTCKRVAPRVATSEPPAEPITIDDPDCPVHGEKGQSDGS